MEQWRDGDPGWQERLLPRLVEWGLADVKSKQRTGYFSFAAAKNYVEDWVRKEEDADDARQVAKEDRRAHASAQREDTANQIAEDANRIAERANGKSTAAIIISLVALGFAAYDALKSDAPTPAPTAITAPVDKKNP